ncbi:MAG: hypothetical protein Q9173_000123 [Seirophora scorigena]
MGNNTLFHHTSFEYPVKTESEALEHIGSYAGHLPFMADSHVRPDGYGLLDHQLLQSMSMPMPTPTPMPVSTPKYSRFPGNFEIPPYVSPFLVRTLVAWPSSLSFRFRFRFHLAPGSLLASSPTHTICLVHCCRFNVPAFAPCLASGRYRWFIGSKSVLLALHPPSWFGAPVTRSTRRT